MRSSWGLILCLPLSLGCGPAVPQEDLGTVEKTLPKLPGTETPYEMPELDRPAGAPVQGDSPRAE